MGGREGEGVTEILVAVATITDRTIRNAWYNNS